MDFHHLALAGLPAHSDQVPTFMFDQWRTVVSVIWRTLGRGCIAGPSRSEGWTPGSRSTGLSVFFRCPIDR
jgi:hypothetical protein